MPKMIAFMSIIKEWENKDYSDTQQFNFAVSSEIKTSQFTSEFTDHILLINFN